jgi:hypothetical protein
MDHFLMPADKGFPLIPGFELYIGGPDEPINPSLKFRFEIVLNESVIAEGKPLLAVIRDITRRVEAVVTELAPLLS